MREMSKYPALFLILALAACGGGEGGAPAGQEPQQPAELPPLGDGGGPGGHDPGGPPGVHGGERRDDGLVVHGNPLMLSLIYIAIITSIIITNYCYYDSNSYWRLLLS